MDAGKNTLLRHIEETARQLGYQVTYSSVAGTGGLARYKNKGRFIINRYLSDEEKIDILCNDLRDEDLQGIFLLPAVRERIVGSSHN